MAGKLQGAYFTTWSACSFVGGCLVLFLVRGFFFTELDHMYWRGFWHLVGEGQIEKIDLGSVTFAKMISCFGLGGLIVGPVVFFIALAFFD